MRQRGHKAGQDQEDHEDLEKQDHDELEPLLTSQPLLSVCCLHSRYFAFTALTVLCCL